MSAVTKGPINVIEIRRATNGYVVSAWCSHGYRDDNTSVRGYATYLVEGDDAEKVGAAVVKAILDHDITDEVVIPPARQLP